jgi:hypothetical protein
MTIKKGKNNKMSLQTKKQLKILAGQTGGGLGGYILAKILQKDETPFVLGGTLLGAIGTAIFIK